MNFLPKDYKSPTSSNNYFKLQEGENRIRILSKPIFGWEDWQDKKPVRYVLNDKPLKPFDPKKSIKHFWAFIVYNYKDKQVQIMQITQATIRKRLEDLCKDEEWGTPFNYDIKISKNGEGMETEYVVNPVPHKPVDNTIIEAFRERKINLDALFTNSDPFHIEDDVFTPLMSEDTREEEKIVSIHKPAIDVNPLYIKKNETISIEQAIELQHLLNGCSEDSKKAFNETLKKIIKIDSIEDMPIVNYENIKKRLVVSYKENQQKLLELEMSNKGIVENDL